MVSSSRRFTRIGRPSIENFQTIIELFPSLAGPYTLWKRGEITYERARPGESNEERVWEGEQKQARNTKGQERERERELNGTRGGAETSGKHEGRES